MLKQFLLLLIPVLFLLGAAPLDGIWRSQGYGYVFEIHGSTLQAYEVTETTCVKSFSAKRHDDTYKGPDGLVLSIESGTTPDHKLAQIQSSVSRIRIDRIPKKPDVCNHLTANTPLGNFDVFAQTWAEHYISFELKHADWNKAVAEKRATVTPATTPSELFEIVRSMITPFGDAHAAIVAPKLKKQYVGLRSGTGQLLQDMGGTDGLRKSGFAKLLEVTRRAYLKGEVRNYCDGKIQWGHVDSSTG
ncbi:MAG TPA: hypothetical protein VFO86_04050, partial [Terriglobia bacterium]|nr:hypothetical protein [Terriglobia bacterium]